MDEARDSTIRDVWHRVQAQSFWFRTAIVTPLLLIYLLAPRHEGDIEGDIRRWMAMSAKESWRWFPHERRRLVQIVYLLAYHRAFRSLLYYRARRSVPARILTNVLKLIYRGEVKLRLNAHRIGPGLYIVHGECTGIGWKVEMGSNCRVHQRVTIGWDGEAGAPRIGNNVVIYPGAVLFGSITIGDGVIIGANAVVTKSVPAGMVARGVPATHHVPKRVAEQDPLGLQVAGR